MLIANKVLTLQADDINVIDLKQFKKLVLY